MAELLEVKNLSVSFFTPAGEVQAVRDVSFSLRAGEVLAIVGESGCGKSVLCKSILHLLPPSARRKSGTIAVNGRDITQLRERELQKLRGSLFSMVFQDPMTALNPSMTVGAQLAAAVRVHAPRLRGAALEQRVLELMRLVGIDRPEERRGLYPHHFSGGMRQRVVLAIALAGDLHLGSAAVAPGAVPREAAAAYHSRHAAHADRPAEGRLLRLPQRICPCHRL